MTEKKRWREALAHALEFVFFCCKVKPIKPRKGQERDVNVYALRKVENGRSMSPDPNSPLYKLGMFIRCRKPKNLESLARSVDAARRECNWESGFVVHRQSEDDPWIVSIALEELDKVVSSMHYHTNTTINRTRRAGDADHVHVKIKRRKKK